MKRVYNAQQKQVRTLRSTRSDCADIHARNGKCLFARYSPNRSSDLPYPLHLPSLYLLQTTLFRRSDEFNFTRLLRKAPRIQCNTYNVYVYFAHRVGILYWKDSTSSWFSFVSRYTGCSYRCILYNTPLRLRILFFFFSFYSWLPRKKNSLPMYTNTHVQYNEQYNRFHSLYNHLVNLVGGFPFRRMEKRKKREECNRSIVLRADFHCVV